MSDLLGLLSLPVPVTERDTDPVSDPLLAVLGSFIKAVLNAELGDAWAKLSPVDPLPVATVFYENPERENVDSNALPAIFLYRKDDKVEERYGQDLLADDGGVCVLWMAPPRDQEMARLQDPIRNGVKKALQSAFARGRHPAWLVDGDDYYFPERYGSVLLRQARCAKIALSDVRDQTVIVEMVDTSRTKTKYRALLLTLSVLEIYPIAGTTAAALPMAARMDVELGLDPLAPRLTVQSATFEVNLDSVSPASGPPGTVVTLVGRELPASLEGSAVLFGSSGANPITFTRLDDSTFTVVAPAHDAGLVTVTLVTPSGEASSTFTFT